MSGDSLEARVLKLEADVGDLRESSGSALAGINALHSDVRDLTTSITQFSASLTEVGNIIDTKIAFGKGFLTAISLVSAFVGGTFIWFIKRLLNLPD